MTKQRCWLCWRELGKHNGEYTFRVVERPGTGHLHVHKACEPAALKFLGEKRETPVPSIRDRLHEHVNGVTGCYITQPTRQSDDR